MKIKFSPLNYWKSIIIISVILYLSFAPPSTFKGVPAFENEDKIIHMLMYGGLTWMLIFEFKQYAKKNFMSAFAFFGICIFLPIFIGGAVEILQPMYFAPRTAEWFDWFSDITGVLVGWSVYQLIFPRLIKKRIK